MLKITCLVLCLSLTANKTLVSLNVVSFKIAFQEHRIWQCLIYGLIL